VWERLVETAEATARHLNEGGPEPESIPARTPSDSVPAALRRRLHAALCALLTCDRRSDAIYLMLRNGLLEALLPELAACHGVPQPANYHPEGDVLRHSALTLERMGDCGCEPAWAALLHDVGKPPVFRVADRIRFHRHNLAAVPLIAAIAKRLAFDQSTTEVCTFVAREHMRLLDVRRMRPGRLEHFMSGRHFPALLRVWRADILASHGDLRDYEFVASRYAELRKRKPRKPLVTGDDLIEMGLTPGPLFGVLLERVRSLRGSGAVSTREDALRALREMIEENPDHS